MKVASIFSGCGGLDFGFHKHDGFHVVYAVDIMKDACASYEGYFKSKCVCADIRTVETIPDCDVLIGGFPCQGFTKANVYKVEGDLRNELYMELVRLLTLKQPKYFVFENVKALYYSDLFSTIMDRLSACGYNVYVKIFKMKWYGVPQSRERVIFVGVRRDLSIRFAWPEEIKTITKVLRDAIGDLPLEYDPSIQHIGTSHKVTMTGYLGNRELDYNKISPTILGIGQINIHPSMKRRMTLREYARIQTFPDDFTFAGNITTIYGQIGNAVPPTFSHILATLIYELDQQLTSTL
jgi:DNA (cytosine-5)-methyltransferase 1